MRCSALLLTGALLPLLAACAGRTAGAVQAPAASWAAAEVRAAGSLVGAMHARYDGRWFRTLRFKQNVIRTEPDGSVRPTEVWTEYAEIPGKLRIDFGNGYTGNGAIYARDSLVVFQNEQVVRRVAERNPLALLAFDVYGQPPARTLEMIREEGIDLGRFHRTTWQGRPAYVVGAVEGDLRSPQFWVDAERLVFVRLLQPTEQDSSKILDIRFNKYEPLARGWIAPEVVFEVDGRQVMLEEYFDVAADVGLPAGLFEAGWRGATGSL